MAKKSRSLLDDVLSRAGKSRPGFKTWYERLPEDARAELDTVRSAFDHRVHQKRAYALAIMEAARERGWQTSGIQGVLAWLSAEKR